ncbi:MAG: hypothetical protein FWH10_06605 [Oscillospiraceae bacterium]|nr:hypothetical protein [Oscillospiraceae bacterium]
MKKFKITILLTLIFCVLLTNLYSCTQNIDDNNNGNSNSGNQTDAENLNDTNAVNINTSFTSKEIADAVMAAFTPEELPVSGMTHFFSGADENGDNYLEPERVGILIHRRLTLVEEFDYLEDYALYVPTGQSIFEVSVLKLKESEKDKIDAVKNILETRMNRISLGELLEYAPYEEPIYANMKVMTVHNYAIILSTTDNKRAEDIISGLLYGDSSVSLDSNTGGNTDMNEEENQDQNQFDFSAVNMDDVVDVESEILFDFDILSSMDLQGSDQQNLNADDGVRRTALPNVRANHHSHNTHFLLAGTCEPGAMIRVTGGLEELFTGSDHGNFLVEVPFEPEGTTILRLTAEVPGKSPSEEISFVVKPRRDVSFYEDYGTFGVIVGYNHMTYFHDNLDSYIGADVISDAEIAALTTRTERKINDLRTRGSNAEIIYLLVPSTSRIWSEDMPKRYAEHKGDSLLDQWKRGVTAGGATVIDLTDLMMANKTGEYKIWHKTDSHWTEYGAYLGYTQLMNYIARRFPDAAPRPRSDFEFYNRDNGIGDIYGRLHLEPANLIEYTTFARFNFDPPHFNPNYNKGHLGMDLYNPVRTYIIHDRVAFQHTTNTNLTGLYLPSVYVMRDSFEGPLHAFYLDRFSTATFTSMWNYNFNAAEIAGVNPDYVLYVISERNIKGVIYN